MILLFLTPQIFIYEVIINDAFLHFENITSCNNKLHWFYLTCEKNIKVTSETFKDQWTHT